MKGNIEEELPLLKIHQQELGVLSYDIINCNLSNLDERNIIRIKIKGNKKILTYPQIIKRHNKWTSK